MWRLTSQQLNLLLKPQILHVRKLQLRVNLDFGVQGTVSLLNLGRPRSSPELGGSGSAASQPSKHRGGRFEPLRGCCRILQLR